MDTYKIFSKFYDQYILETYPGLHKKYYELVIDIIKKFNLNVDNILDASCGTGLLAKIFLDAKYNIEGSDISNEMLKYARKKGIKVYNQNICDLKLKKKYDIILFFDSFGHIIGKKNIYKTLLSISNHLNENGLFICDGGTKDKANNMIGKKYIYKSDKYDFIWENSKFKNLVNVNFKIYDKIKNKDYNQSFFLEGHNIEDIILASKKTGMSCLFSTLEPIVKKNGSFIVCFRKN